MKKITLIITGITAFLMGNKALAQTADTMFQHLETRLTKAESDLSFWKKLKINGWVQAQYQVADTVGAASVAGGNFPANSNNRFILRRGRIKFTYEHSFAQ